MCAFHNKQLTIISKKLMNLNVMTEIDSLLPVDGEASSMDQRTRTATEYSYLTNLTTKQNKQT